MIIVIPEGNILYILFYLPIKLNLYIIIYLNSLIIFDYTEVYLKRDKSFFILMIRKMIETFLIIY